MNDLIAIVVISVLLNIIWFQLQENARLRQRIKELESKPKRKRKNDDDWNFQRLQEIEKQQQAISASAERMYGWAILLREIDLHNERNQNGEK